LKLGKPSRHQGVSEIIGAVILVVIVVGIYAVIFSSGLLSLTNFSNLSQSNINQQAQTRGENFVEEYAVLSASGKSVYVTVRNYGITDIQVVGVYLTSSNNPYQITSQCAGLPTTITTQADQTIACTNITTPTIATGTTYLITIISKLGTSVSSAWVAGT
jgi:hypothetical protein